MRVRAQVKGGILIYLGAMSPGMMRLSGQAPDGVLPLLFPPERYAEARTQVLAGATDECASGPERGGGNDVSP